MATAEVISIPNTTSLAPPESCMIAAEELWKTYDMGSEQQVHALRGVNLRIQRNEYVAIMGPSGSGKSTLMNLIGCLDTPSQGKYWLNGQLVSELDDDELARICYRLKNHGRDGKGSFIHEHIGFNFSFTEMIGDRACPFAYARVT